MLWGKHNDGCCLLLVVAVVVFYKNIVVVKIDNELIVLQKSCDRCNDIARGVDKSYIVC